MSTKGIYTAVSGAMAQNQRLDTIANNIANANTTAFKRDQQTFREYLTAYEKPADVVQAPQVPAAPESFYNMQAGDRGYVDASGSYTDLSQGTVKQTGNPLDMAIEGKGFFEVLTAEGVMLTRGGSFRRDSQGQLVNGQGFPVLREGVPGEDPATRTIQLQNQPPVVTQAGEIYQGDEIIGRLSVVNVENNDALQKVGNSQYKLKPKYEAQTVPAKAQLKQGYLEMSNVNVVQEMTDMISATRAFETAQKVIKAYDELQGRLVNEVPRFR